MALSISGWESINYVRRACYVCLSHLLRGASDLKGQISCKFCRKNCQQSILITKTKDAKDVVMEN